MCDMQWAVWHYGQSASYPLVIHTHLSLPLRCAIVQAASALSQLRCSGALPLTRHLMGLRWKKVASFNLISLGQWPQCVRVYLADYKTVI
jgi:hypothetical protein